MSIDDAHVVTVDDDGIRPAGSPDACFYCRASVGKRHSEKCVMVKKVIRIELSVTMTYEVPRSWDAEQIDFHFNDGSYCLANLINDLHKESEASGHTCVICNRARVTLLDVEAAAAESQERTI